MFEQPGPGKRARKKLGTLRIQRRGRQRERQKNNRFNKQNNNFARASHFVCAFLSRLCTTATWKYVISRFMEDVKKQRRNSIPLFELGYGRLKFSFRRVRLHLTKYVGRNNRYKDWKNANSLFKRRSFLPSLRWIWCQGLFCKTRSLGYKLHEFFKRKEGTQAILLVTSPFLLDAKW